MIFLVKFALLGALMQKVNVTYPAVPEFADQPVAYPGKYMQGVGNAFAVGYAPSNDQTSEVMELVKVWWYEFGDSTTLFMMPFNSAEELHQMYMNGSWPGVGVIFDDPHLDSLDYTLRFPPQYMPPTSKPYVRKECKWFQLFRKRDVVFGSCARPLYRRHDLFWFRSFQNVGAAIRCSVDGIVWAWIDLRTIFDVSQWQATFVPFAASCRSYKNESSGVLAPDFKCLANVYSISGFVALQNLISTAYTSVRIQVLGINGANGMAFFYLLYITVRKKLFYESHGSMGLAAAAQAFHQKWMVLSCCRSRISWLSWFDL